MKENILVCSLVGVYDEPVLALNQSSKAWPQSLKHVNLEGSHLKYLKRNVSLANKLQLWYLKG